MEETFLEKAWDDLLSRDPKLIEARYKSLDPKSQKVVIEHLQNMVTDTGWHPVQVISAQNALDTLTKLGY
ncbi:MAG: hypothetical protein CVU42_09375 [Chloroflexi bacterium HGW-Chloroflexi-4]|jgi:hypothetical protein|nr:MAG: hypothetical protein CVU45_01240 [Chloroflexi bacterium HGW-Chloroflexi-7]PKN99068.1 MAG: hypothetical protein CVU42_09375 [Chloroflexi bacterium HGW-Chloroflexi-4]